jgi:hypothetical protein
MGKIGILIANINHVECVWVWSELAMCMVLKCLT